MVLNRYLLNYAAFYYRIASFRLPVGRLLMTCIMLTVKN